MTARESWDDANHNLFSILFYTTSGPAFSAVRRFEGKTREDGVGHRQDAWRALRDKFAGCSREPLRVVHRELETVKMRSDEYPDDFLDKKDRRRDHLNSVTPKEGPSDRRYEDIFLLCLPPEYDRIHQTHFEREDCNLENTRWMMSKIYADNLARSHSDSSRGIAGRDIAMQATGRDLSKINCYFCNKFDHYKDECADFKAAHHQNRRRRQRHHKQRGGHQPDQPKPGGQQQQRGGGQMWCSYHKTTTHNDADCHATPENGLNGNAHFALLRAFLGSAVRWTSLCEMTATRSPASHSSRERSSLRLSPPKLEWRRRGPGHSAVRIVAGIEGGSSSSSCGTARQSLVLFQKRKHVITLCSFLLFKPG